MNIILSLTISSPVLASPVSSPITTTKTRTDAFEKSNSFEKEGIKIADNLCAHKQYEIIKDVSTKDSSVLDGNDTETSSFGVINSENEVKNQFTTLSLYTYSNQKFRCITEIIL